MRYSRMPGVSASLSELRVMVEGAGGRGRTEDSPKKARDATPKLMDMLMPRRKGSWRRAQPSVAPAPAPARAGVSLSVTIE